MSCWLPGDEIGGKSRLFSFRYKCAFYPQGVPKTQTASTEADRGVMLFPNHCFIKNLCTYSRITTGLIITISFILYIYIYINTYLLTRNNTIVNRISFSLLVNCTPFVQLV